MSGFREFAVSTLRQAQSIPRGKFRTAFGIDVKPDESPVTIADTTAERFIRAQIHSTFPDHAVTGEEFGDTDTRSGYRWIIDPIDGTRSFVTGHPLYGMLLGLLHDQDPILGAIHMPELQETYIGHCGESYLNEDTRLRCSLVRDVAQSRFYINEGDKLAVDLPDLFQTLCRMGSVRRLSYDCYPYALLAAGHIDLCIDYDLKPFDFLPLIPVIEGAGGVVSDWQGNRPGPSSDGRIIAAATPELRDDLLRRIAPHL